MWSTAYTLAPLAVKGCGQCCLRCEQLHQPVRALTSQGGIAWVHYDMVQVAMRHSGAQVESITVFDSVSCSLLSASLDCLPAMIHSVGVRA